MSLSRALFESKVEMWRQARRSWRGEAASLSEISWSDELAREEE